MVNNINNSGVFFDGGSFSTWDPVLLGDDFFGIGTTRGTGIRGSWFSNFSMPDMNFTGFGSGSTGFDFQSFSGISFGSNTTSNLSSIYGGGQSSYDPLAGATAQLGGGGFVKPQYPNNNNYLRNYHMNDLVQKPESRVFNINQFYTQYNGYTLGQLLSENKGSSSNSNTGTNYRYLYDPLYEGIVIDMKHFLNSIIYSSLLGNLKEEWQNLKGKTTSAYNPQDYYSNNLGNEFYKFYLTRQTQYMLPHDKNIMHYIYIFLTNKSFRNGK
ncbi:MAG: hypothetical protein R2760_07225 [Chitinophagales bacterium]